MEFYDDGSVSGECYSFDGFILGGFMDIGILNYVFLLYRIYLRWMGIWVFESGCFVICCEKDLWWVDVERNCY